MKRTFIWLVAGCLSMAGCASVAPKQAAPAGPAEAQQATNEAASPPPGDTEKLPPVELNPRLLYQLLVGEVAAQRGDLEASARAYLQVAAATHDPRLARRAAQISVYAQDYRTALKAARLWVREEPTDLDAVQSLAALLIHEGHDEEALKQLQRLLALSPDGSAHGFMLVANILAREPDKQRALHLMEALVKPRRHDANAVFAYANLAYLVGQYDLALKQLDGLLAKQPGLPRVLVLKASVLRRMNRNDEAIATYRQAVDNAPRDASLRLGFARILVDEGRLPEARKQFHILGQQLPDNGDVIYAEALLALQAQEVDTAEQYLKRLLKLGQHSGAAAFALGQIAESRNQPEVALKWYRQVDADSDNYIDAAIRSSVIISHRQGAEQALEYLHQVEPQSADQELRLRLAEGEILRDAERYKEAMAVYDAALQEFPDNVELLYARAMTAENMNRIDLLERDLHAILKQDPDNVQALNALGYTLADRTKRYKEAYDYVKRAYKQRPDDPAIIDSMGWALYHLGRLPEAEKYLREALSKQFDDEIAAHLGEVLWKEDKKDAARKVWRDALKKEPASLPLKKVIQRFER